MSSRPPHARVTAAVTTDEDECGHAEAALGLAHPAVTVGGSRGTRRPMFRGSSTTPTDRAGDNPRKDANAKGETNGRQGPPLDTVRDVVAQVFGVLHPTTRAREGALGGAHAVVDSGVCRLAESTRLFADRRGTSRDVSGDVGERSLCGCDRPGSADWRHGVHTFFDSDEPALTIGARRRTQLCRTRHAHARRARTKWSRRPHGS